MKLYSDNKVIRKRLNLCSDLIESHQQNLAVNFLYVIYFNCSIKGYDNKKHRQIAELANSYGNMKREAIRVQFYQKEYECRFPIPDCKVKQKLKKVMQRNKEKKTIPMKESNKPNTVQISRQFQNNYKMKENQHNSISDKENSMMSK